MNAKGNRTKVATDRSDVVAQIPAACSDEAKAVLFFENARWGDTAACPRCGSFAVYQMVDKATGARSKRWLWRCRDCQRQYSVRVGTIMEDSPIPMRHWALIFWLMCSGKKSVSALQVKRMTGLTYKSALFAVHRVRWAMAEAGGQSPLVGTVEADECYVGGPPRKRNNQPLRGARKAGMHGDNKLPVVAVVQRDGYARASVMRKVNADNVREFLKRHVSERSRLMTDESYLYKNMGLTFPGGHETVKHSAFEFARGEAYTNTVEGFFSQLKRQLYGTHHAVSQKHLHRYVAEVQYKYNTRKMDDGVRTMLAIRRGDGRRLTHKQQLAG